MVTSRSARGASLVEVTAAIVVLAGVAGSVAWLAPAQRAGIVRSHQDDVAVRAAEAWIEGFRAQPSAAGSLAFAPEGGLPSADGRATVEDAAPGLLRVTAEVAWDAADGGRRTRRLVTLVAVESAR